MSGTMNIKRPMTAQIKSTTSLIKKKPQGLAIVNGVQVKGPAKKTDRVSRYQNMKN